MSASKHSRGTASSRPFARAAGRGRDVALVGIGIVPNGEIARAAGLAYDSGISVDVHARTSDPDIYSPVIAPAHLGRDGQMVRLESVQNAIDQAKHAALAMMGKPVPYREVPWFWSDQYDLKLQIAGLPWPGDRIVCGATRNRGNSRFSHLREGRVAAVEAVNAAPEYMSAAS